jgi:hypothetical protein
MCSRENRPMVQNPNPKPTQIFNKQKSRRLPGFLPWYQHHHYNSIQEYFEPLAESSPHQLDANYWNPLIRNASRMYTMWEQVTLAFYSNFEIPFSKCLWFHKHSYVIQKKQPRTWECFFNSTPFQTLGYIEEE